MTALCPACETCAHCAKHGCIPVSGDAPVAAHRVVCDGRGKPIGYIAHDKDFPPSATGKWAGRSLIDAEEAAEFAPGCITAVYTAPSPLLVVEAGPDLIELVSHALRKAYQLGQTYWQQADSESFAQHRKADATHDKFTALVDEVAKALSEKLTEAPK